MKRILSLIICLCMVAAPIMMVSASATDIDDLEAQQEALEEKSAEYEAILNQKESAVEKQQEKVDALVGKVQTVNEEITLCHKKISLLDDKITEKQNQIIQASIEIEENMNILRKRIKTIYLAGDVSSLEIIMGAKDFSDFLDKLQLVKSVSTHDEKLIKETQLQLEERSKEKEELQVDKNALEEEQTTLKEKQDELNSLLEEHKEVLASLQEESDEALQDLVMTEEQLGNLSAEIRAYYEEQAARAQAQNNPTGGGPAPDIDIPADGSWVWPTPGVYYISSSFYDSEGRASAHGALDIAGAYGTTVVAATGGTVVATCASCTHNWGKYYSCGCGGGYGNYVWISSGDGKEQIYAHLASVSVSVGQSVSAGQVIGYMGSTGHSTGAHLHFETRYNGIKYDPQSEF